MSAPQLIPLSTLLRELIYTEENTYTKLLDQLSILPYADRLNYLDYIKGKSRVEGKFKELIFNYFQHGRKGFTIWLSPEPRAAFEEIQATLWSVVPDCKEVRNHKNGFTPHLSVGQVRDQSGLRRIQEELQLNWRTLEFEAFEVCLISREDPPDDVFRVNYRVGLGSNEIITE